MELKGPQELAETMRVIKARLSQYKDATVRVCRQYPYHCVAYALFALSYLVPVALDLLHGLVYALTNLGSAAVFAAFAVMAVVTALWQWRVLDFVWWGVIGKWLELRNFTDLNTTGTEDIFKSEGCLREETEEKEDQQKCSSDVRSTPDISDMTVKNAQTDSLSLSWKKDCGELSQDEPSNSVAGLSTELFPSKESDICLVPDDSIDSTIKLIMEFISKNAVKPLPDGTWPFRSPDPGVGPSEQWTEVDLVSSFRKNGESRPLSVRPDVDRDFESHADDINLEDRTISYVHYSSPSPDCADRPGSIDVLHRILRSGRSSPASPSSNRRTKNAEKHFANSETDLNCRDSEFFDPELDLDSHELEISEATLPYKDSRRDRYLAQLDSVLRRVPPKSSPKPVIFIDSAPSQSWGVGSFTVWKGFRWRKCNVVVENECVKINLWTNRRQDQTAPRWTYPLLTMTVQKPAAVGCGLRTRFLKLSAPQLPTISLRPIDHGVEEEFLRAIGDCT